VPFFVQSRPQPIFNPDTSTYDFPWVTDPRRGTDNLRRILTPRSQQLSPLVLKDGFYTRRPCAVVAGVLPGSPAEEAGIKLGDQVRKISLKIARKDAASEAGSSDHVDLRGQMTLS
jgi:hypothetical protein